MANLPIGLLLILTYTTGTVVTPTVVPPPDLNALSDWTDETKPTNTWTITESRRR